MSTRAEFLARIRREMAKTPGLFAAAPADRPTDPRRRFELLRRELSERRPQMIERFRAEFERVAGVFHRVASASEVAPTLERICRERDARRVVAWPTQALGVAIAPALTGAGIAVESMPRASVPDGERQRVRDVVATADLGVTGADLAIAETGTLVLISASGRPPWSVMVKMSASIWVGCQVPESPFQTGTPANAPRTSTASWPNPRYSMPSNMRPSTRAVSFTDSLWPSCDSPGPR